MSAEHPPYQDLATWVTPRLPSTSTSSTGATATTSTSYPVSIVVDNARVTMSVGSVASVAVVTGRSRDAITVPTSAVTRLTSMRGTVQVVKAGQAVRQSVTVGLVGTTTSSTTSRFCGGTGFGGGTSFGSGPLGIRRGSLSS